MSRTFPIVPDRGSAIGRALLEGDRGSYSRRGGRRRLHLHGSAAIGRFSHASSAFRCCAKVCRSASLRLTRSEARPFTDKQIELVTTFADQAAIAIENVRLFDEVQAKTRDLSEALTYQTGSSNILSVIASSPTDVGPVLKAIVESACELCEAYDAVVTPEGWRRSAFQRASRTDTARYRRNGRSTGNGPPGERSSTRSRSRARSSLRRRRRISRQPGNGAPHGLPQHSERTACCARARASEPSCFAAPRCIRSAISRSPCFRPSPIRP